MTEDNSNRREEVGFNNPREDAAVLDMRSYKQRMRTGYRTQTCSSVEDWTSWSPKSFILKQRSQKLGVVFPPKRDPAIQIVYVDVAPPPSERPACGRLEFSLTDLAIGSAQLARC